MTATEKKAELLKTVLADYEYIQKYGSEGQRHTARNFRMALSRERVKSNEWYRVAGVIQGIKLAIRGF